jgi:hypothetical protein
MGKAVGIAAIEAESNRGIPGHGDEKTLWRDLPDTANPCFHEVHGTVWA